MNGPPLSRLKTTIALLLMMAIVAVSRYEFLTTSASRALDRCVPMMKHPPRPVMGREALRVTTC